jgi:hypothetical protein
MDFDYQVAAHAEGNSARIQRTAIEHSSTGLPLNRHHNIFGSQTRFKTTPGNSSSTPVLYSES